MGNSLVSNMKSWIKGDPSGNVTLSPVATVAATITWSTFIAWAAFKFIFFKPWGMRAEYRRAMGRCEEHRKKGLTEFEQLVSFKALIANPRMKLPTDEEEMAQKLVEITNLPFSELREKLQLGDLNASTVLAAFVTRMLLANQEINAVTEVIREAFNYAENADDKWENSHEKPPLYGMPFSVKSNFFMKNYDCCVGVAKLLEQPKDVDCPFVTHLVNLGAIPFVLTNVPQGLLSFVCSNSVYGTTRNPLDKSRSPGGSSGGEAALFAAGATSFGTGSDLAGSLRIPASMCGLTTLKPTQERFVVPYTHGGTPGRGRLGLSFGFFTHTVDEQIFLLQQIVGSPEYRKLVPQSPPAPLNFKIIDKTAKLRIGFFDDDGFCPPVPSHRRVVNETIKRLEADGHIVMKFTLPNVELAANLFYKNLLCDNGAYMCGIYSYEYMDEYMKQFAMLLKAPTSLRWLASKALSCVSPQMSLITGSYMGGIEDVRRTQELTDDYRLSVIDYWKALNIDVLICPAFIVPAVPHKYPANLSTAGFATGLFNLLDFPAGVVPTGHVSKADDEQLNDEAVFPVGRNPILKLQRQAAEASENLPCSVQCVALPHQEELCLFAMQQIEKNWKE